MADVTDGTSATILTGEKRSRSDPRVAGRLQFWDEPFLTGEFARPRRRRGTEVLPDLPGIIYSDNWGSAAPSGANFPFLDGSVRPIRHGAGPTIMQALLSPRGGEVPPSP